MKTLKKVSIILLALTFLTTPVSAKEIPINSTENVIKLVSDTGIQYEFNIQELNINAYDNSTDSSVTYVASTDNMTLVKAPRGSLEDDFWDSSQSVSFLLKLTWKNQSGGIVLTNVSGKYTISQGDIQISQQKVVYACNCPAALIVNQTGKLYPTSSSFSVNTGFTKVVPDSDGSQVSAGWTGTIKRGSTWTFEIPLIYHG